MQAHMDRSYSKLADWMYRFTKIATTTLAVTLIFTSPANAASVPYFSDNSDHHDGGTGNFNFSADGHGAMDGINFYKDIAKNNNQSSAEFGYGHSAKEWDSHDFLGSSRGHTDADDSPHYTTRHDGAHGDFSWLFDHDKHFDHDEPGKTRHKRHHDSRDDRDHHDFWEKCDQPAPVPVPGAIWLFGSGVAGLLGLTSRRSRRRVMAK